MNIIKVLNKITFRLSDLVTTNVSKYNGNLIKGKVELAHELYMDIKPIYDYIQKLIKEGNKHDYIYIVYDTISQCVIADNFHDFCKCGMMTDKRNIIYVKGSETNFIFIIHPIKT